MMDLRDYCLSDPQCIGWSNVHRRLYYISKPRNPPPPGVEVIVTGSFSPHQLLAGIPIGYNYSSGSAIYGVMGTLTWFAKDKYDNYYAITDSHVVQYSDYVYFPPPILLTNPTLTAEKDLPIVKPVLIGEVIYKSNLNVQATNEDIAVIKLYEGIKPTAMSYGKQLAVFPLTPNEGETVVKVGARTGLTSGLVLDISATIRITEPTGILYFTGPVFALYSAEGDSGAPVFVGNALAGSIVAGTGAYAIANDISVILSVLSRLGLEIIWSSPTILLLVALTPLSLGAILSILSLKL